MLVVPCDETKGLKGKDERSDLQRNSERAVYFLADHPRQRHHQRGKVLIGAGADCQSELGALKRGKGGQVCADAGTADALGGDGGGSKSTRSESESMQIWLTNMGAV